MATTKPPRTRKMQQVPIRLDPELFSRIDSIRSRIGSSHAASGDLFLRTHGGPSRASVLRAAVLLGVEQLEKSYADGAAMSEAVMAAPTALADRAVLLFEREKPEPPPASDLEHGEPGDDDRPDSPKSGGDRNGSDAGDGS